jgi:type IX secretion system PorP/SprF family membrane protein
MKHRFNALFWVTFVAAFLGTCKEIKAQDPEFTQFYANPLYLNPAFTGSNFCPRVNLNYRNQWPALSGTFVTNSASFDKHIESLYGGLGVLVVSDRAGKGTLTTNRFSVMYAKPLDITRTFSLRFGVEATYFQKTLDWSKLSFGDQIDPRRGFIYSTADFPGNGQAQGVDFSAGMLGYSENFFFGFSAHHLTEPNESLRSQESPLPLKISGHAGANIQLPGSTRYSANNTSISPNIMYRKQGNFQQLNLGVYVKKGVITGGFWYRNKDAFIATVGVQTEFFKLGYSYDITVSKLSNATAGSHEISLGFNFKCKPAPKSYRMLECPGY